jgi:hypothetical protein
VLVYLDVRRSPAAISEIVSCQAAVVVMSREDRAEEYSLAPPQVLRRGRVLDHAPVPGRAPGLGAGQRRQRASGRDEGSHIALDRMLVQVCSCALQMCEETLMNKESRCALLLTYRQGRGCRAHV